MSGIKEFCHTRIEDLKATQTILVNSWTSGSLPAPQELTLGRICTSLAVLLVLNLSASLVTRNGR